MTTTLQLTRVTENIAVIVEGERLNQSLLVVSHFDSSTLSPGTYQQFSQLTLVLTPCSDH